MITDISTEIRHTVCREIFTSFIFVLLSEGKFKAVRIELYIKDNVTN